MGLQWWTCAARSARSTSPGATSNAPCTRWVLAEWAAHHAARMQPRLCATSSTGPSASTTVSSSRAVQSPRSGRSQVGARGAQPVVLLDAAVAMPGLPQALPMAGTGVLPAGQQQDVGRLEDHGELLF